MTRHDHIPTVEEAMAAQKGNGLHETYWWVTGWDFNRPVIAKVGVGAHFKTDPYARGSFDGVFHRAKHLTDTPFEFVGPIECPRSLLGEEPSDQMNDKTLEAVNLLPGKNRPPSK